jgi:hypothetical protein
LRFKVITNAGLAHLMQLKTPQLEKVVNVDSNLLRFPVAHVASKSFNDRLCFNFPFLRAFSGYAVALDTRCWQNRCGEVSASLVRASNL